MKKNIIIITTTIIVTLILLPIKNFAAFSADDLGKALELYKKGAYAQALKNLDSASGSSLDKNVNSSIHYLRGLCYSKLQEFDSAVTNFETALQEGNSSNDIHYELGQAYYAARNMPKARAHFEASISKDYLSESSYYYIGYISQMLEEHQVAIQSYAKIKNAKEGLGQSARFQIGELLLTMAERKEDKQEIRSDVVTKVIPVLTGAYDMDPSSPVSKQVSKRMIEIKEKYDLDENKMVNGRRLSPKRFSLKFKESVEHDSNVVSEADQSTAKASYKSSLIMKADLNAKNIFAFKRRYLLTPEGRVTHTRHTTHRKNINIQKNDAYSLQPKVKAGLEHTLLAKMGTASFESEFNYTAKDDQANGHLRHSGRTWSFSLEEKLGLWSKGDSTLKLKRKQYDAKVDSSDSYTNNFSLIQMLSLPNTHTMMGLFNADFTTNPKSKSNSQNSFLTRVDYIVPTLFSDNLQLSAALAFTITDTKLQRATRGTETTINPSLTLSYKFLKLLEASFRYEFSKTNSKDKTAYDYKKHLFGLDIEVSI
ncbi:MAG: tetratricopeptide repeat protein [Oligoflexia bacterium]|nr:tetratricopeptide repeat protein [Oligoflexia bacterium]MBF0363958.1 tetratricopeptide repeat protein [Oligoflexia bacterium]